MKIEDIQKEKESLKKELETLATILKRRVQEVEAKELASVQENEKKYINEAAKDMYKSIDDMDETTFEISQWQLSIDDISREDRAKKFPEAEQYFGLARKYLRMDRFADSKVLHMKGDILITDPGYICREENPVGEYPDRKNFFSYESEKDYPDYKTIPLESLNELERSLVECEIDNGFRSELYKEEYAKYEAALNKYRNDNLSDWEKCGYGDEMEILGIKNYLIRDTIYGDWSCTTYNSDTGDVLGTFCADAGLVGVFLLDEVLAYNPDFDVDEESKWAATIIRGFEGDVQIIVERVSGTYEEDSEYHKKGEYWEDYVVRVVGTGNINFITAQTGF